MSLTPLPCPHSIPKTVAFLNTFQTLARLSLSTQSKQKLSTLDTTPVDDADLKKRKKLEKDILIITTVIEKHINTNHFFAYKASAIKLFYLQELIKI